MNVENEAKGGNPKVDFFFSKPGRWQEEFQRLREIILGCGLTEELKWGQACYTFNGANVVLIHGFKEYCALLVFKGALLKDANGILVQQTQNVQAARQIRFSNAREILKMKPVIKAYVKEAMAIENSGLKVELKKTTDFQVPQEFQTRLDRDGFLRRAFESLTPGRQRSYLLYFLSAKQSQTRESRIEKCLQKILDGKGLND